MQPMGLLLATVIGVAGCAHQSAIDRIEFVVAKETIAFDKRPWQGKGNLRPYEKGELRQPDGTIYEVISHSCGFANFTYRVKSLDAHLKNDQSADYHLDMVVSTGEWCRVRQAVIDSDELLQLRNWHGEHFLERSAPILKDADQRPFVVDSSFIEYADLANLAVPLSTDPKSEGCFAKSDLTPDVYEGLSSEAELVETPEGACFKRGVYLRDLVTHPVVPNWP